MSKPMATSTLSDKSLVKQLSSCLVLSETSVHTRSSAWTTIPVCPECWPPVTLTWSPTCSHQHARVSNAQRVEGFAKLVHRPALMPEKYLELGKLQTLLCIMLVLNLVTSSKVCRISMAVLTCR